MFVVFRTDANPRIGTGHLMRCLALADALAERGAHCLFLCRGAGLGRTAARIAAAGHDLYPVPEAAAAAADEIAHSAWLPHGQSRDAELCRGILQRQPPVDWLVVDHYALAAPWQTALRPAAGRILVIDDLADRRHDCDLLVDQNFHPAAPQRYAGLLPAAAGTLTGPRYALLRPEFARLRQAALARRLAAGAGPAARLLVLFGGADAADLTGRTVDLLARQAFAGPVDVVVGPLYPGAQALGRRLAALPGGTLHVNPGNVAELMAAADLAIGSPGGTSWERCALGLPTVAIAAAANQEAMARTLAEAGAHAYLGRHESLADADFAAAVAFLASNAGARRHMAEVAGGLADGRGAERIARRLLAPAVAVRPASGDDAARLFSWRNDPRVRRRSFDPAPLVWDDHRAWIERTLADPARVLLVGTAAGEPAGCVRFDLTGEAARVSLYLDPERLGQGLAVPLLDAAAAWLAAARPEVRTLVAEVRSGNAASTAAFLGAGYAADHAVYLKHLGAPESP